MGTRLENLIENIDPSEILRLTKSDKKMSHKGIRFILLKKVGKAVIDNTVTDEEIYEFENKAFITIIENKKISKSSYL